MSTFIERHGYIKYPVPGYERSGPCEIPKCDEYRLKLNESRNKWAKEYNKAHGTEFPIREEPKPSYYVDHCHLHGWVRGIICGSCNTLMGAYDKYGHLPPGYDYQNDFLVTDPLYYKHLDLKHEADGYKAAAFIEYAKNCPECAGLPAPEPGKKTHLMYTAPRECPVCHGNKVLPPAAFSDDRETDTICDRCNGAGVAVLKRGKCNLCGKYGYIADEIEGCCLGCLESSESSESEEEFEQIMSELSFTSNWRD